MVREKTILLTHAWPTILGGGGESKPRKGERKERDFRERSSTLSLKFPVIGLSNPNEPRDKVDLHGKGYAWTPILWNFDNSKR